MDEEQFGRLDAKIDELLSAHVLLKHENERLLEERRAFLEERATLKSRIDAVLEKLDRIGQS